MMLKKCNRSDLRRRRHIRVCKKIVGDTDRPRLVVFKSLKHIYAQVIDDTAGVTIVSASTLDSKIREPVAKLAGIERAKKVGEDIALRAVQKGIKAVIFDRGGYKYHGQVAALAQSAREKGLEF